MENTSAPGAGPDGARVETSNGVADQPASGAEANGSRQQTIQRAEEMVDRWGEQIGQYAFSLGHGIRRLFSRAREEAEDIWAEAQAIARGQRAADQSEETP
jgi:hypothetical protein